MPDDTPHEISFTLSPEMVTGMIQHYIDNHLFREGVSPVIRLVLPEGKKVTYYEISAEIAKTTAQPSEA